MAGREGAFGGPWRAAQTILAMHMFGVNHRLGQGPPGPGMDRDIRPGHGQHGQDVARGGL